MGPSLARAPVETSSSLPIDPTQMSSKHASADPAGSGGSLLTLACLLGDGVLIGLTTCLAQLAADVSLGPLAFLTWSLVGATAVLVLMGARLGTLPPLRRDTLEYFLVAGLVTLAAPQLLLVAAVPHVGPAFVVLSLAFPPLYTYVGALLLGMERFHPLRALGVLLALGGAALLASHKLRALDADAIWVIATLVAPVLLAIGNLYRTARWPRGASPQSLAPGMLGAASLLLLVFGVARPLLGTSPAFGLAVPYDSTGPGLLILAQTVLLSATYVLFFILQERGGPVVLSLIGSVAAVFGVPFAVLVLREPVPEGLVGAGLLIACGVALVAWFAPARRPAASG